MFAALSVTRANTFCGPRSLMTAFNEETLEETVSVDPCVCALVEYWLRGGDDVVHYSLPTNVQPPIRDDCNTVCFLYDLLDLHLNSVELCIQQITR